MADHRYFAELGIDAGSAVKAFGETAKEAQGLSNTLSALDGALKQVSTTQVKNASTIGENLKMYQQLSSAVGSYARASKALADPAAVRGQQQMGAALASMRKELQGLSGQGALGNTQQIKENLELYKQLADVSRTYTASLKNEAQAVRDVAAARGSQGTGTAAATQAETAAAKENLGVKNQLIDADQEYERGLAATRYALYEIAAAYTAVSAAALALPVSSARAAIEMEQQFAHVARTTQAAEAPLGQLRDRFVDLSTEIPVTFEELSKIGTLGAQMGIAAGDLESFADTVAKFSATTDVSVDQASMSFGRLSNMMHLTSENYEALGASISELGTASVATESEILTIAESIATTANMAGFSADEVVGLSTAMASLRIRPEMARGAMQRVFAQINAAVADGTDTLTSYAGALGITEEAAADLWRNDPSQFFQGVAQAIGEMDDNIQRSQFIREGLGLRNVRDIELLNRLSNGYEVYADSMTLANDAYARGDYLEKEAGVIFETTAASLEKLGAAFRGMLDSFGQESLGPIQGVAEVLIRIMNAIRDLPAWAKGSSVALLAVVGAFAAYRAAIALTLASLRAFRLVNQQLNIDSVASALSVRNLRNELRATFPAAAAATGGIRGFSAQLSAAQGVMARTSVVARGMWTAIGGPIGLVATIASVGAAVWGLVNAHESAAESAKAHADAFIENAGGMESLMQALRQDAEELASGVQSEVLGELNVRMEETEPAAKTAADALQGTLIPAHEDQAEAVQGATDAYLEGIGAIGEYTDAWMRAGLADALSKSLTSEDVSALISQGFDFDELVRLWQTGGAEAARGYTDTFASAYERHFSEHDYASDQAAAIEGAAVRVASIAADVIGSSIVDLDTGLDQINSRFLLTNELGIDMFDDAEEGAAGLNDEVQSLADSFNDLVSEMFGLVDAEAAVYAAMEKLGQSLDENGNSFDIMTEKGRANMDALQGLISAVGEDIAAQVESGAMTAEAGAQAFGQYVESIIADLGAMGVDTSQFDFFRDHLDSLFATPVVVDVEVDHALNKLEALQTYAIQVLNNIAAQSGGVRGALASWGAGVVKSTQRTVRTKIAAPDVSKRNIAKLNREAAEYQRQNTTQLARSRAEQERLAKGAEKANKSTKDTADQAKRLKEQIAEASDEGRIFEETMKELRSAFSETLDRFGGHQAARDSMEGQLIAMRKAAESAKEEVKSLRDEARSLRQEARDSTIEAQQAEIFASVARRYGDTTRYDEYSNEAKKARENAREKNRLASAADKEATALDKNRLALTGYSEQAIKNREDVRRLQSEMADLIIAYAETGATTEQVTRYAEDLRRKFVDQLTQMGYNRRDVERLSGVFKDLKRDIERVPREVRVRARADVAEAQRKLNALAKGRTVPVTVRATNDNLRMSGSMEADKMNIRKEITTPRVRSAGGGGGVPYSMLADGGQLPGSYSGPLNKDDKLVIGPNGPEASVRSGEWVMPVPAVSHYGKDFMNAVQTMKFNPIVRVQAGAGGGSGIQDVNLLPHNIQQIARAVSTVLAVDGKVLAATTNAQNTNQARRGNG